MKFLYTSDTHRGFSQNTIKIHEKWAKVLKQESFDAVILAGDLGSNKQHQVSGSLKFWREVAGDKPVLYVNGNHDVWDQGDGRRGSRQYLEELHAKHVEWAKEYSCHWLQVDGPYYKDGVCVVGWDGWYAHYVLTNDQKYAPISKDERGMWRVMQDRAHYGFQSAIIGAEQAKKDGDKVVAVTHMPLLDEQDNRGFGGASSWWEHLAPHADVFVYGHTHIEKDLLIDNVRCLNSGSDYDKPVHRVFEV